METWLLMTEPAHRGVDSCNGARSARMTAGTEFNETVNYQLRPYQVAFASVTGWRFGLGGGCRHRAGACELGRARAGIDDTHAASS